MSNDENYCVTADKRRYDKKGAVTLKNLKWKNQRIFLREYFCDDCQGWHVTRVREHTPR